jgi:hypothetical protein
MSLCPSFIKIWPKYEFVNVIVRLLHIKDYNLKKPAKSDTEQRKTQNNSVLSVKSQRCHKERRYALPVISLPNKKAPNSIGHEGFMGG